MILLLMNIEFDIPVKYLDDGVVIICENSLLEGYLVVVAFVVEGSFVVLLIGEQVLFVIAKSSIAISPV